MYKLSKHIALPILVIAVLVVASLACGVAGKGGAARLSEQTSAPGQPTLASQSTAAGVGKDTPFGKIAAPEELNSYRARIFMELRKKDGTKQPGLNLMMEWVKQPPSQHVVMGEGQDAIELITIEDRTWIKVMGKWAESSSGDRPSKDTTEGYLPDENVTVKSAGEDTVNGVHCKRSTYSGKVTVNAPQPDKPDARLTFDVEGEVCVANQSGLPPVIIREKSQIKGNLLGSLMSQGAPRGVPTPDPTVITYWERELYDINKPITIKPPEGATVAPGRPTPLPTRSLGGAPTPRPTQPSGSTATLLPKQMVTGHRFLATNSKARLIPNGSGPILAMMPFMT